MGVQMLVKHCLETGEVPVLWQRGRRLYAKHPDNLIDEVLSLEMPARVLLPTEATHLGMSWAKRRWLHEAK